MRTYFLSIASAIAMAGGVFGAENFADSVATKVGSPPGVTAPLVVPYITWGGDMATFYANGGLETKAGSIFAKQGLNLKLVAGDNFDQQVKDYLSGKSAFLRGTFSMLGIASEAIGKDPRTKGVVVLQLTWSVGDHMIARANIKTVSDLKGKTIALQRNGPHVGMLDDVLKTAQLLWSDIKVVWTKDLTASDDCPSRVFKKDSNIDACFAITPDMMGLTGGLQNTGTGAESTVKGARVLVSTAQLSRSIADIYVVRKDFYDAQKSLVIKFVAGYLKACEEVLELKKAYEAKGSKEYVELLKLTQSIYGKETIPTPEEDAHGLLSDCVFVGHPGQVAFFNQEGNLHGFQAFLDSSLKLGMDLGYVKEKCPLVPSGFDYSAGVFTSYLAKTEAVKGERFRAEAVEKEIEALSSGGELDDKTIVSFTINFEPNQNTFSAEQYGAEYKRVVEMADKYGNAVIAIRGHSDPTKVLVEVINAGMKKGIIQRTGTKGNFRYSINGKPLDFNAMAELTKLIETGELDGVEGFNPRETMQAALNLSRSRAEAVRDSIVQYAKSKGMNLDKSQIQPTGVGIREPFIAKPKDMNEAKQNMRVEFRLVRVAAEAMSKSDFDF